MKTAYVSEVQRFCVHDGPGIRTTVFYQGCPLRCCWCQNPETISPAPIILYNAVLCAGCGSCIEACPQHAITVTAAGTPITDPALCNKCGACCDKCYFLARKLSSKIYTVDALFTLLCKDEVIFRQSGGGVTISGGEPLLQADFNLDLLTRCKAAGYSTAVETAGLVPAETLLRFAPLTDTFLFDLKLFTAERHAYWTGVSNARILSNLRALSDMHDGIVIRIPLIPGVNDTDEEFGRMMDFVATLRHIERVHLLPFHQLGADKYALADLEYELHEMPEDNTERIEACRQLAAARGLRVNVGGTGFKDDKKNEKTAIRMAESYLYEV